MSTAKTDEEAPGEMELPRDEEGYPLLPDNAMELSLEGKKGLIRKYMAEVRSKPEISSCHGPTHRHFQGSKNIMVGSHGARLQTILRDIWGSDQGLKATIH
jgi:hypothetical protein